jgi:AraC-like DNA-binding protein
MSEALLLTGKRGQGKTLYALSRIRRYMMSGRMVATNLNLNVDKIVSPLNRVRPYRLPDHPSEQDFIDLPLGNPDPKNDGMNGLLVLDEASTFLNARSWDTDRKGRLKVIGWLAQSRKFGWDLLVIAQHANMIDAQIREALFEHFGVCVNLQGMLVPFVSRFTGGFVRFPRVYRVSIRLGFHPRAPLVEHDFFRGTDLFDCYDTLQVINPVVGVPSGSGYSYLSAFDLRGRFMTRWQRMKKFVVSASVCAFVCGVLFSKVRHFLKPPAVSAVVASSSSAIQKPESSPVVSDSVFAYGYYETHGRRRILLTDERDMVASAIKRSPGGAVEYESDGVWYRGR